MLLGFSIYHIWIGLSNVQVQHFGINDESDFMTVIFFRANLLLKINKESVSSV